MKVIEFKPVHVLANPQEQLTVNGVPMVRESDGTPVKAGDLEVGKAYAVRADGVLLNRIATRQVRRAQARKGRRS